MEFLRFKYLASQKRCLKTFTSSFFFLSWWHFTKDSSHNKGMVLFEIKILSIFYFDMVTSQHFFQRFLLFHTLCTSHLKPPHPPNQRTGLSHKVTSKLSSMSIRWGKNILIILHQFDSSHLSYFHQTRFQNVVCKSFLTLSRQTSGPKTKEITKGFSSDDSLHFK